MLSYGDLALCCICVLFGVNLTAEPAETEDDMKRLGYDAKLNYVGVVAGEKKRKQGNSEGDGNGKGFSDKRKETKN